MLESAQIAKVEGARGAARAASRTGGQAAGTRVGAFVAANGEVAMAEGAAASAADRAGALTAPLFSEAGSSTKEAACQHCLDSSYCANQASSCYYIECGDAIEEWCYMCTDPAARANSTDHEYGMCGRRT